MDDGHLVYEYNMMIIEDYQARSAGRIAPGEHVIEVVTTLQSPKPLSAADVVLKVDGKEWRMDMDDGMYLIDGKTLRKRTTMSKFGVNVGDVPLSFQKR